MSIIKDLARHFETLTMKRGLLFSVFVIVLTSHSLVVQCQSITLSQTNKSGIYSKGQRIIVTAYSQIPSWDTLHIRVYKNNTQLLEQKDILKAKDSMVVYNGSFSDQCSVLVEAKINNMSASLGMLVDPENLIPGAKCPKDFKAYWSKLKKSLDLLPMEINRKIVMGTERDKGYLCEDVEINCLGPKPARGYYSKPEMAAPKTLPIVLLVHAAGVKGAWCRSEPGNALTYAKMGALCFDLNFPTHFFIQYV